MKNANYNTNNYIHIFNLLRQSKSTAKSLVDLGYSKNDLRVVIISYKLKYKHSYSIF